MSDDQSTRDDWNDPPVPSDPPPVGDEPAEQGPPPAGTSRRAVLQWAGVGVLAAAALGAGAVAVYATQSVQQDKTTRGARVGEGSGTARGERAGRTRPGGPRGSGMATDTRPSGAPTSLPTDAPSSGG
ncbi:MAG: hypothetical protein HY829_11295 [Actinobacteria bacterium]|nr:hypothetical protein [Actinomycetota bacterium]